MFGLAFLLMFGMAAGAAVVFDWSEDEEDDHEEIKDAELNAQTTLQLDDTLESPAPSENGIFPVDLITYTFETDDFESNEGSVESDLIELDEGHHMVDVRGGGSDTIDAEYADTALIFFGGGDLVLGPEDAEGLSDFVAVAVEGGELQGGAGNEYAQAIGNGATLCGNAGDDMLLSDGGMSTLIGGEGNDTLVGGMTDASFYNSDADDEFQTDDRVEDHLSGGAGDDLLRFSTGDIVEGGEGADRFEMEINATGENSAAVVQDFNEIDDSFLIEMRVAYSSLEAVSSGTDLAGSNGFSVNETDAGTELVWNGNPLCLLANATEVSVHVTIDMPDGQILHLHWQDGEFSEGEGELDSDVEIFVSAIL